MSELIERLRELQKNHDAFGSWPIYGESADEIERLTVALAAADDLIMLGDGEETTEWDAYVMACRAVDKDRLKPEINHIMARLVDKVDKGDT